MSYERDNIRAMSAYEWGEQPDSDQVLKLNTNENPFPASPKVAEALNAVTVQDLRRYPPPTADGMRRQLARLHDLTLNNFVITNGGDEALRLALTTFVEPGSPLGMLEPSYSLYPVLADIQGATRAQIPLTDAWQIPRDFAQTLNEAGANLACIVNPHAPSGTLIDVDTISQIANDFNGVLLVDEAYVDFVDPALRYDLVRLVNAFDNLLLLRTFSKGYSLAGLRLGYLIGADSLIAPILEETWRQIRSARRQLRDDLIASGLQVAMSQSNFLLAEVPLDFPKSAFEIYQELKARDILVRYFQSPLMEDKLRISVGTASQNARLMEALNKVVNGDE
jgi:histidinol-phosphate aminotransferase